MNNQQLINFIGIVLPFGAKRTGTFKLQVVGQNNYIIVFSGDNFIINNLQEDDRIAFDGILTTNNTGMMISKPIVIPVDDEVGLRKCFIKAMKKSGRFGDVRSKNLYDALYMKARETSKSNEQTNIITYLDNIVQENINSNFSNINDICDVNGKQILDIEQTKILYRWWLKTRLYRLLYICGFTNRDIKGCHKQVDKILEICRDNPLKLLNLDFPKCSAICDYFQITLTDDQIREGFIAREFNRKLLNDGWTSVKLEYAMKSFHDLPDHIDNLIKDYDIKLEFDCLYLPFPYICENYIKDRLIKLANMGNKIYIEDIKQLDKNQVLNEIQLKAIVTSINNNVSVITGGPGVGKSTVIRELINQLRNMNVRYAATSFTGKAVSRLIEILGKGTFKTKDGRLVGFINTMHKMIFNSQSFIEYAFEYLIIDESSMVSSELLYNFFKTFRHNYKIIFVGDIDQLQPIDFGFPFYNIIKSNIFPITKLEKNYRVTASGELDCIIKNIKKIIEYTPEKGLYEPFDLLQGPNFRYEDSNIDKVYDIIRAFHKNNYDYKQVTIICPYNKYQMELNQGCQKIYFEENECLSDNVGNNWFIGDRICLRKNINSVGYNGQSGEIVDFHRDNIYEQSYVTVKLEQDPNEYNFFFSLKNENDKPDIDEDDEDIDEKPENTTKLLVKFLRHSYALTVHLVQGSQIEYIIIYIPPIKSTIHDGCFLNRNLAYTAISRACKGVFIVGDINSFRLACMSKPKEIQDNLYLHLTSDKIKNITYYNIEEIKNKIEPINKVTEYINTLTITN